MITTTKQLADILTAHDLGMSTRNNWPSRYLHLVLPYFNCIKEGKLDEVPAPTCVQMQVSATCSTQCEMCHHWKEPRIEMNLDEWRRVFADVSEFGVRTAIFSGGEPLMRMDLPELLHSAFQTGLKLGVLTNGTMVSRESEARHRVIAALAECADWVSISVDGTKTADLAIRNPIVVDRIRLLQEFVSGLREVNQRIKIWATVTLQNGNIQMNFHEACKFIQETLGISEVNFKIATGARRALEHEPPYLLKEEELVRLVNFLQHDPLPNQTGNQLAYLRECFSHGIFNIQDTAQGAPLHSFYEERDLRCFTPFLFSLIDNDGEIYPCCHLYRDNQGTDPRSKYFREEHSMGNIKRASFSKIWNGDKYVAERMALETINPDNERFLPCGECTRHCQHNLVLTQVYKNFKDSLEKLEEELKTLGNKGNPVFF